MKELITSKNVDSKTLERLYKAYGKNNATTLLCEKIYPDSLCEIVKNSSITTKSKQMVIILKFNSNDIVKILENLNDKELLYFIIKEPKYTYQDNFKEGVSNKQFLYTNSPESKKKIQDIITSNRRDSEYIRGLIDAQNKPLFNGKKVMAYDSIIQGHVHFQMEDNLDDTKVHTLRVQV